MSVGTSIAWWGDDSAPGYSQPTEGVYYDWPGPSGWNCPAGSGYCDSYVQMTNPNPVDMVVTWTPFKTGGSGQCGGVIYGPSPSPKVIKPGTTERFYVRVNSGTYVSCQTTGTATVGGNTWDLYGNVEYST